MGTTKPLVEMPDGLTDGQQIDWLAEWLVAKTEGPCCVPQKGLREGEGAIPCAARLILERDIEIARLRQIIDDQEHVAFDCYENAREGRVIMPNPVVRCPCCGAPELDFDGIGCVACPRDPVICYCQHPSVTDDICGICHDSGPRIEATRAPSDPWKPC